MTTAADESARQPTIARILCRGALLLAVTLAACGDSEARAAEEPRVTRAETDPELVAALDRLLAMEESPEGVDARHWARVRALYEDSAGAAPLWLDEDGRPTGRTRVVVEAVSRAPEHALRVDEWPIAPAAAALRQARGRRSSPAERALADVMLSALFTAYASDLATGRTDPRDLGISWYIDPGALDLDSALAVTARADVVSEAMQRLVPQEAGYSELVEAHVRYRGIAASGGWPFVGAGDVVEPGDTSAVVPVLRERLSREGYLPAEASENEARTYDSTLAAAVATFQARHGLAVDSLLGPGTRSALDVSAAYRAAQIAANLERFRWLPPRLGSRYVLVNVPEFRLQAFDSGEVALDMRVVVGSELTNTRTPAFADSMSYVQFGPYWNVPDEIAKEEILPKALEDPGYLERNEYEVVSSWEEDGTVIPVQRLSREDLEPETFRYRIRQRPGPLNALGSVKFMFPNSFAIYLHDTPAEHLFDERVRAFSHGCVRVEHPERLADFVLRDHPEWTPERIRQALESGERVRVDLPAKIPVYLLYLTAFVRDDQLQFRDDLYDRDDQLIAVLGGARDFQEGTEGLAELRSAAGLD